MRSPVQALLDANVLFSNHLRNLLLQLAQNEAFEARWTERIEEEWLRNMEERTEERIRARTLPLMRRHFPDALVSDFDPSRIIGTTDPKDRHVASAAATVAPCILVTNNIKDFDAAALAKLDVRVLSPDEFLVELFEESPEFIEAAAREAAENLTKTSPSWSDYLNDLGERAGLKNFAERLRSLENAPSDVDLPTENKPG
jgi:PIN domain